MPKNDELRVAAAIAKARGVNAELVMRGLHQQDLVNYLGVSYPLLRAWMQGRIRYPTDFNQRFINFLVAYDKRQAAKLDKLLGVKR